MADLILFVPCLFHHTTIALLIQCIIWIILVYNTRLHNKHILPLYTIMMVWTMTSFFVVGMIIWTAVIADWWHWWRWDIATALVLFISAANWSRNVKVPSHSNQFDQGVSVSAHYQKQLFYQPYNISIIPNHINNSHYWRSDKISLLLLGMMRGDQRHKGSLLDVGQGCQSCFESQRLDHFFRVFL